MGTGYCNSCGSELPDEAMYCHKCGSIADDSMTPADFSPRPSHTSSFPSELREFYEGSALIGVSKFSRVFGVNRKSDGKWVTVKVLISPDTSTGRGFIKGITAWQRLLHHNIARLYAMNMSPVPYLEMELCESGCLDDIKKPLPKEVAATIVFDISKGLRYAHSIGIIHTNLSPYNILLKDGVPKITDWGLSRGLAESKHISPDFSLKYAAPEQILPEMFGHPDERTDVYQLGTMFYELITGKLPSGVKQMADASSAIAMEVSERPSVVDPGLKDLDPIITKAMAKKMSERYQDMGEFQDAISEYLKLELKRSLELSVSEGRPELLAYYCSSLIMVHAHLGDVKGVLKYAINLKRYAPDRLMSDVDEMIGHLVNLHETGTGISEEFFKKIGAITPKFGTGKFTWTRVQMKERLRREEWEKLLEDEQRRKEEAVRRRRIKKGQQFREGAKKILSVEKRKLDSVREERLRKEELERERGPAEEQREDADISSGEVLQKGKPASSLRMPLTLLALAVIGLFILGAWWSGSDNNYDPDKTFINSIGIEFVPIPAGEFDMGSPSFERGKESGESPVHRVTISTPFYIGKYEVTQGQWREVMGNNPSYFEGCDDCPIEEVSWNDVQEFIKRLNKKEGTDKYRLPTEAEWEYAARAGTGTRYSFGDYESTLGKYAWYSSNSDRKTHPVGEKKPNPWGLYDMHGNVWEWVQDWYGDYSSDMVTDPTGPPSGHHRVERGCGWNDNTRSCRVAHRHHGILQDTHSNTLGFRLARSLSLQEP